MKPELLNSLKKSISRYTILDNGGQQVKCQCKKIYREFVDERRMVVMITVINVNNIIFN